VLAVGDDREGWRGLLCLDGSEKKNACDEKKQGKNAPLQNDLLG
jgi:hypothetical protein